MMRWYCRTLVRFSDWLLNEAKNNPDVPYDDYKRLRSDINEFKTKYARYLK